MFNFTSQINWIPSYIGLKENKGADKAAQESLTDNNSTYLSFVFIKDILNENKI